MEGKEVDTEGVKKLIVIGFTWRESDNTRTNKGYFQKKKKIEEE